jgi:hypothetical protein
MIGKARPTPARASLMVARIIPTPLIEQVEGGFISSHVDFQVGSGVHILKILSLDFIY